MIWWFLLLLLLCGVLMSAAMAFFPMKVLIYVKKSRMWGWYFKTVFGLTSERLSSDRTVRSVRVQGIIGLAFTSIALWGCLANPNINF